MEECLQSLLGYLQHERPSAMLGRDLTPNNWTVLLDIDCRFMLQLHCPTTASLKTQLTGTNNNTHVRRLPCDAFVRSATRCFLPTKAKNCSLQRLRRGAGKNMDEVSKLVPHGWELHYDESGRPFTFDPTTENWYYLDDETERPTGDFGHTAASDVIAQVPDAENRAQWGQHAQNLWPAQAQAEHSGPAGQPPLPGSDIPVYKMTDADRAALAKMQWPDDAVVPPSSKRAKKRSKRKSATATAPKLRASDAPAYEADHEHDSDSESASSTASQFVGQEFAAESDPVPRIVEFLGQKLTVGLTFEQRMKWTKKLVSSWGTSVMGSVLASLNGT